MRILALSHAMLLVLALVPSVGHAQPQKNLSEPEEFAHEFSSIGSVRVLRGGQTLATDWKAHALIILSARQDSGRRIGRQGDGPTEYRVPRYLFAVGQDSILVVDAQSRRWLLAVGDRLQPRTPFGGPPPLLGSSELIGVDRSKRGYWQVAYRRGQNGRLSRSFGGSRMADTVLLVRMALGGGPLDTITGFRGGYAGTRDVTKSIGARQMRYVLPAVLNIEDQVAVCADGWVATAKGALSRIEWTSPSGARVISESFERFRTAVTGDTKRLAIEREMGPATARYFDAADFPPWPARTPSFARRTIQCLPDGTVMVQRYTAIGDAQFIIVGRDGKSRRTLELPNTSTVVGTDGEHLFVAREDDDGIVRLWRYRM